MTYNELAKQATTWTASQVANNLRLMFGDSPASEEDIRKVNRFQIEEGGEPIAPTPFCSGNPTMSACIERGYCGREFACND